VVRDQWAEVGQLPQCNQVPQGLSGVLAGAIHADSDVDPYIPDDSDDAPCIGGSKISIIMESMDTH
jgi:hypothetical protein